MVNTIRYNDVNQNKSQKFILNLDCSLKIKNMKVELLVIFNHYVKVNRTLDFVHTAHRRKEDFVDKSLFLTNIRFFIAILIEIGHIYLINQLKVVTRLWLVNQSQENHLNY
jgi:hypothetical protein